MTGPKEGEARRPVTAPNWRPSDIALIRSSYGNEVVALRCGPGDQNQGWAYADSLNGEATQAWSRDTGQAIRPLVVIDPEDHEQVERLASAYSTGIANRSDVATDLQAALRSLLAPPKPEEPLGLGAVVEDSDARLWVRTDQAEWTSAGDFSEWASIAVTGVLSLGVTE